MIDRQETRAKERQVCACRAYELANEHKAFTGETVFGHGALTVFLGQGLLQAQAGVSFPELRIGG